MDNHSHTRNQENKININVTNRQQISMKHKKYSTDSIVYV